ncbi:MAG: NADP-dependent oxidoreductase [Candidatus Diapherotrites archaeon]|nr:NADP-dependent oxidoreductase [Candidatus Diapherotrites archaeon]
MASIKSISKKPKKANFVEAASMPLAGISAWQALSEHMNLSAGQKILVHGGAGGIGSNAIQIAKHLGAFVAATVSPEDKQFVKKLGADQVIDYKSEPFERLVNNFDAVFDTVGGDTYKKSFQVLKKDGIIVSMLEQPDNELVKKFGVRVISQFTQVSSEKLSKLGELVDRGKIKVFVDKTFPLIKAAEALDYLQKGHHRGKVLLKIK